MKNSLISFLCLSFIPVMTSTLDGAVLFVAGQTHMSDTSNNIPWVLGSEMWEKLDSSDSTGTANDGFASIPDAALFTFTYGTLALTNFVSPGADSPGFEFYSEGDAAAAPLEVFYDGVLWATGEIDFLRVDVENSNDGAAIGTGIAVLNAAGADDVFFNEVMSLTGGTGELLFDVEGFFPVSPGVFNTTGTVTAIPEPAASASVTALAVLLGLAARRWFRHSA